MRRDLRAIPGLCSARALLPQAPPASPWSLPSLRGRLVELSAPGGGGLLTCALALVRRAQGRGAPVAWLTPTSSAFFPPDAARAGIRLAHLPVLRLERPRELGRAACHLLRADAFDLLVLDLGEAPGPSLSVPLLARMSSLARRHDSAALCLTRKPPDAPSLGPTISVRVHVTSAPGGAFAVRPLKDPRHGTTWCHTELTHGLLGMC